MSDKHHGNPVATYIITALILGVITYIEFAIVEYEIAWLSRGAILFWLIALSVIKFIMVVAIFMHLKDDERTYTGFFSSGMLIALATFMIMPLLFTVRTIPDTAAGLVEGHSQAAAGLAEEERSNIETDGASRSTSELLDTPRPADRSLSVTAPPAGEPQATLRQDDVAQAEGAEGDDAQQEGATEQEAQEQPAATEDETQAAEEADEPEAEPAAAEAATDFDRELGESVYAANCQACHQANGAGMPGVFPPLADNLPQLHDAEGGREYLIDVLLYGLTGQIEVNGQTYNGAMPAWAHLSDEQIAAVLNHALTAWGNEEALDSFSPIAPAEVATQRGEDPGNLNERRSQLQAQ